jgi:hypothetical protein
MVAALINTDDCLINSSIVDLIDRLYGPCHTDADAEVLLSHAAEWISSASPLLDPGCLFCNAEHTQIDNKHMLLNTIKKNELVPQHSFAVHCEDFQGLAICGLLRCFLFWERYSCHLNGMFALLPIFR